MHNYIMRSIRNAISRCKGDFEWSPMADLSEDLDGTLRLSLMYIDSSMNHHTATVFRGNKRSLVSFIGSGGIERNISIIRKGSPLTEVASNAPSKYRVTVDVYEQNSHTPTQRSIVISASSPSQARVLAVRNMEMNRGDKFDNLHISLI